MGRGVSAPSPQRQCSRDGNYAGDASPPDFVKNHFDENVKTWISAAVDKIPALSFASVNAPGICVTQTNAPTSFKQTGHSRGKLEVDCLDEGIIHGCELYIQI